MEQIRLKLQTVTNKQALALETNYNLQLENKLLNICIIRTHFDKQIVVWLICTTRNCEKIGEAKLSRKEF